MVRRDDIAHVTYVECALPPLELTYRRPRISDHVDTLDVESRENLPAGVDGVSYRFALVSAPSIRLAGRRANK